KDMGRGKPYDKRGKKADEGGSGGGKGGGVRDCFICGVPGHRFFECPKKDGRCFKCGDPGHKADQCKKGVVCFNCKEE
ncbi:cellular nucleic acid-binding protein, partial [Trifolium medium]|nr:cellular nucleic acid-binding protein [Trifolium medium]